jgi:hypothetical protein
VSWDASVSALASVPPRLGNFTCTHLPPTHDQRWPAGGNPTVSEQSKPSTQRPGPNFGCEKSTVGRVATGSGSGSLLDVTGERSPSGGAVGLASGADAHEPMSSMARRYDGKRCMDVVSKLVVNRTIHA